MNSNTISSDALGHRPQRFQHYAESVNLLDMQQEPKFEDLLFDWVIQGNAEFVVSCIPVSLAAEQI
ncbi:MAG: hypothetical protein WBB28_16555 [Crinalium sp.]